VKLGLWLVNVGPWADPHAAGVIAETAEELGFDSLWTGDHVVFPEHYTSRYPYAPDGKAPIPGETPIAEPLAHLAWLAGRTSRIELATGVLVLALRNPVAADVLSGGRITLGVGIGWLKEEYDACGVPWARRGQRTEDYVAAARALWSAPRVSFESDTVSFAEGSSEPRPVSPGGVPVVIGGNSPPAARRAGRIGDGWMAMNLEPEQLRSIAGEMRAAAVDAGRDPDAVEITYGIPPGTDGYLRAITDPDELQRYAEVGVDRVVVFPPCQSAEEAPAALERLASHVMANL
jgi:probable F420-dependent oxidoreductase